VCRPSTRELQQQGRSRCTPAWRTQHSSKEREAVVSKDSHKVANKQVTSMATHGQDPLLNALLELPSNT
jgi:hypothetical protein